MNKKIFLLGVILLITGQFLAAQNSMIKITSADGTEMIFPLSDVQNIVFRDSAMMVNLKNTETLYWLNTKVTCIRFNYPTGIKTLPTEPSVSVFPNPVQTNLTVSGVNKDIKINLFDLKGTLLQSIPAQDNSTNIDVSSLPAGLYLLQIREQVVKFIKQ